MNENKLILPVSILLGCIILGGFYYLKQLNEQKFVEKQQKFQIEQEVGVFLEMQKNAIELEQKKVEIAQEKLNTEKRQQESIDRQRSLLDTCLQNEEIRHQGVWDYYLSDKAPENTKIPTSNTYEWGLVFQKNEDKNKEEINNCYRNFPVQ